MRKVIRDNKLGMVLSIHPTNYLFKNKKEIYYLPELIELVESKKYIKALKKEKREPDSFLYSNTLIRNLLKSLGYTDNFTLSEGLVVTWIDLNRPFIVIENHQIKYQDEFNWEVADEKAD